MRMQTLFLITLETVLVLGSAVLVEKLNIKEWIPPQYPQSIYQTKISSDVPASITDARLGRQLPVNQLPPPKYELQLPPLSQIGEPIAGMVFIPPIDPAPVDPFFNMEFFIGLEANDSFEFEVAEPYEFIRIDSDLPAPEIDRLGSKFGDDKIDNCVEDTWKCGKIEFGDGFTFEIQVFMDGFESETVGVIHTGAASDNSELNDGEQPVGILDKQNQLPVFTATDLRYGMALLNNDTTFQNKGLVIEVGGLKVDSPLPAMQTSYTIESRTQGKRGAPNAIVDFGPCALAEEDDSFCSFVFLGGNGVLNGLQIMNAQSALVIASDNNSVTNSSFVDNVTGVLVKSGVSNSIRGSTFAGNRLGIDLGGDEATENDTGDLDKGANNLHNYPILAEALISNSSLIRGTYEGQPNLSIEVDFFASETGNCSRVGQNGERLLGSGSFITDASGRAVFKLEVAETAERFEYVTATATDTLGNTSEISPCVQVVTGVASESPPEAPAIFALDQNFPNPFNPSTEIRFSLPETTEVRLIVFDAAGREIARLVDGVRPAGIHRVRWDAKDLASGVYVYRLEAGNFRESQQMVMLK